uniref:Ig-like domain-containing protein n=1 Tax=Takifugu rubripes TaxID=31033 RepID=A0A3B5KBL1_TAKRU
KCEPRVHVAVTVVCAVSEDCVLPCSFHPGSNETIQWFRQGLGVYTFKRGDGSEDGRNKGHEQLAGRGSIYPPLVSHGNATLIIRRSGLKDRGTYRCHVSTSEGEQNAKVIVKVEGECTQVKTSSDVLLARYATSSQLLVSPGRPNRARLRSCGRSRACWRTNTGCTRSTAV